MATWDDVRRLALALPGTSERLSRGHAQWRVADKLFVWERPLRRSDLEALGDRAPGGPILGARVEHLLAKEALLADDPDVYFTTPHFDGYPAVLVQLDRIDGADLEEVVVEACCAERRSGWPPATSGRMGADGEAPNLTPRVAALPAWGPALASTGNIGRSGRRP